MSASTDAGQVADSPISRASVARMLAAVVFGASLIQALSEPLAAWDVPDQWPRAGVLSQAAVLAVLVAGFAVQSLGIVVARRSPEAGLVVAFAAYVGLAFGLATPAWSMSGSLPIAVVMFLVAFGRPPARAVTLLVATLAVFWVMHLAWISRVAQVPADQWGPYELRMFMSFAPPVLAGAVLGGLWGRQTRTVAAARREAEVARREHEQRIARAREAERERIAQELHDVAAQHLAGLLSLADAATDLAESDPDTAVGLIADVRAEGRFAVASLHGALGELRARGTAHTGPTPDVQQVDHLVERWRTRGMDVELLATGNLAALPTVVSVTAYRTVREALANATKHAPGARVNVRILADLARLTVVVENTAPTRPGLPSDEGFGLRWGLRGLRERLALLDGTLHAGPTPDGGWRVRAELPLTPSDTTDQAAQWAP